MIDEAFLLFCDPGDPTFWTSMKGHTSFKQKGASEEDPPYITEVGRTTLVILDEGRPPQPDALLNLIKRGDKAPIFFVFTQHKLKLPYYGGVNVIAPGAVRDRNQRSIGMLTLTIERLLQGKATGDDIVNFLNGKVKEKLNAEGARKEWARAVARLLEGQFTHAEIVDFLDKKLQGARH